MSSFSLHFVHEYLYAVYVVLNQIIYLFEIENCNIFIHKWPSFCSVFDIPIKFLYFCFVHVLVNLFANICYISFNYFVLIKMRPNIVIKMSLLSLLEDIKCTLFSLLNFIFHCVWHLILKQILTSIIFSL